MSYNHVISIVAATERRAHIRQEFGRQGIDFCFFDALTPSPELTQAIAAVLPELDGVVQKMSGGEKACLMSHVSLWQKCIDDNLPYIAVFEDDVFLGRDAAGFLSETAWLDERFPVKQPWLLNLETVLREVNLKQDKTLAAYCGRAFYRVDSTNSGGGAYMLSQAACRLLLGELKKMPSASVRPIDVMIYDVWNGKTPLQLRQLVPALCLQSCLYQGHGQLGSGLEAGRAANIAEQGKRKMRRTWWEKIKHWCLKPVRMIVKRRRQSIPFV
ncbi:MAG: glycosyltransferase family 25 protein [Neisseria sp.]|nr:glycosyltransferase family 25 protein [Neisseria sp.]